MSAHALTPSRRRRVLAALAIALVAACPGCLTCLAVDTFSRNHGPTSGEVLEHGVVGLAALLGDLAFAPLELPAALGALLWLSTQAHS